MKAAQIIEYGDASVISINEIEKPRIKHNQVLVEVYASSINPFDIKLRSGRMKDSISLLFPVTLGGDIAGIVREVGSGVSNLTVGDKVYGQASIVAGNSGAFAEFAATAADQVAISPANLNFEEAASLSLVGVSALQAITKHIVLQPGQRIFIHGGGGSIGAIAIQIAKSIGAYVATTATGSNIITVKNLGADEVIDYKTQDFADSLKDMDAIFDTVGGEDFNKSLNILKKGGVAVSTAGQADESKASELGITVMSQSTKVTTESLDDLREHIEAGAILPQVGKIFLLDQIQDAFTALESRSVSGKIVIKIR